MYARACVRACVCLSLCGERHACTILKNEFELANTSVFCLYVPYAHFSQILHHILFIGGIETLHTICITLVLCIRIKSINLWFVCFSILIFFSSFEYMQMYNV